MHQAIQEGSGAGRLFQTDDASFNLYMAAWNAGKKDRPSERIVPGIFSDSYSV